jgi:photosystem II stability/assembly factor-like uncharacterized protein
LRSVCFIDADNGTAVGVSGLVVRTSDGGSTWEDFELGSQAFYSVSFADTLNGTISGYSGGLYHTTDGGITWVGQASGVWSDIFEVFFGDGGTGIAACGDATILRTTNVGTTWSIRAGGTRALSYTDFSSVSLVGTSTGVAVGDGIILRTDDAGVVWVPQRRGGTTPNFDDVFLVDPDVGTAVGDDGAIWRTTDGGRSWTSQTAGTVVDLNDVFFVDRIAGWVLGEDLLLRTVDGGATWTSHAIGDFLDLCFSDRDRGWVVGSGGMIQHTTDGGISWTSQVSGTPLTLYGVSFTDSVNGIAAGSDGTIVHTTNGGMTWQHQTSGTVESLYGVTLVDPNIGIAVGGHGEVLRTTNGGITWAEQVAPSASPLRSVSFLDANIGVALGDADFMLTMTGGTGIQPPSPTSLLAPADGDTVSMNPVLQWNPSPTALGYTLQVSPSPYFITYALNRANITEPSYVMNGLASDATYYWRVSLTESTGTSGWSETWSFTTSLATAVTVDVHIDSLDMYVPALGDTFTYQITLENQTTEGQTVDVWTKVLRPVGNPIDPLYGPESVTLAPLAMVVIDTPELPVPYNAVEGNYALVAFVGAYQSDTLHADTAAFVKLRGIPCDSIDQLQARCRPGGTIQARIVLMNSTEYAGEQVIMGIDGVNNTLDVITNGTHSKAQTQLAGQSVGDHTVMLVSPTGCFDPVTVTCSPNLASNEEDWLWDEDAWKETTLVASLPSKTALLGNYPNPFNPSTTFRYALSQDAHVSLKVYNMLGQLVATVVDESQLAGYHSAVWDGSNEFGQRVSSGIYICRLTAGEFVETKRMLLVK